jgi:hypothetical protein
MQEDIKKISRRKLNCKKINDKNLICIKNHKKTGNAKQYLPATSDAEIFLAETD